MSETAILQEVKDLVEREQIIKDSAFRKEKVPVRVEFSQNELDDLTEQQVRLAIKIEKLEVEKKAFMDDWNDRTKPKKADQKVLLDQLDKGYKIEEMELYAVQDFDEKRMKYYDPEGFLRHERDLLPEEYQKMIKS